MHDQEYHMQIGELVKRIDVPYRHARYVLEEGMLPAGADENPGRGGHRQLEPKQAFWLALLLILKANGMRTRLAQQIADDLRIEVRVIAANLGWDRAFNPFVGKFETEHTWFADVAELRYLRLVTSANPSRRGLYELPWTEIGTHKPANITPVVYIRIDLARLARKLLNQS
jgi:DNA-binding transcriptional MerR regulator